MQSSIFLIGPMGAGKTSVGRQLARELGKQFYDSDLEIQKSTGVDVGFIFDKEGEQGFRTRERDVIDRLSRIGNIVLATGGGAIVDPANQACLTERGVVVYLQASIAQQLNRTRMSRNRPLLEHDDPQQVLSELAAQREPVYQHLASTVIKTDGRKVNAVVGEIVDWYRNEKNGTQVP